MSPKSAKGILQGLVLLWRYLCWLVFYVFVYLTTRSKG